MREFIRDKAREKKHAKRTNAPNPLAQPSAELIDAAAYIRRGSSWAGPVPSREAQPRQRHQPLIQPRSYQNFDAAESSIRRALLQKKLAPWALIKIHKAAACPRCYRESQVKSESNRRRGVKLTTSLNSRTWLFSIAVILDRGSTQNSRCSHQRPAIVNLHYGRMGENGPTIAR